MAQIKSDAEVEEEGDYWHTIGIDPGKNTGIASYHRILQKIEWTKTMDFWECFFWLQSQCKQKAWVIVIEAPVKTAMYAKQEAVAAAGSAKRGNRMMANAAQNAHEADLLATGIELLGYHVIRKRPRRGKPKTAEAFRDLVKSTTGYEGESNDHTRCAIMLAWGV